MAQSKQVILVVDDEQNALLLRKMVLEHAGYSVLTASSMAEAMQVVSSNTVDLVLSDQLMPRGTGTELAKQVKAQHPGIPVAIISGVNEIPSDASHADLFMSKVEGPAAMCEKISSLLDQIGDTSAS